MKTILYDYDVKDNMFRGMNLVNKPLNNIILLKLTYFRRILVLRFDWQRQ